MLAQPEERDDFVTRLAGGIAAGRDKVGLAIPSQSILL